MRTGSQLWNVKALQEKDFCSGNKGRDFLPFQFASVMEALATLYFGNQAVRLRRNVVY